MLECGWIWNQMGTQAVHELESFEPPELPSQTQCEKLFAIALLDLFSCRCLTQIRQ